ncbi:MAG: U32 family peptidase [Firmicutes bacterium]|nr:U32 family peptidase [Bacillota bacterium]MCM1401346.1 U32 family peptidase [Bacteroides sp.]MCM1477299.1 U32 family peptidase [Bacteroides sp.]
MTAKRKIELLAPARDAQTAIEAISHGADAVYIGSESHGARSAAANSVEQIARVVNEAHRFGVRVYVTLNTLVYDNELRQVEALVKRLYRIGVDALIVQDMALLRMDIPPIDLHASTQCDIRTPARARFLWECGFSQLVLPREMTIDEMAEVNREVPQAPLEAFVHGALCVSYSGDCQAGFMAQRRSANRGECPQICRHRFDLVDSAGNKLIEGRHLLSLKDLNRSELIGQMLQAGISSFKIEGRLKEASYVKNTVAAYRNAIDRAIALHPDLYERSSMGISRIDFTPDLTQSFNRGFTTYFTTSARPAGITSPLTPKWTGPAVGKVLASSPRGIKAELSVPIANGDGLGYFNSAGVFTGFRVNRMEGQLIIPASAVDIPRGTTLYRNHNRLREARLAGDTARRTIAVDLTLRAVPGGFALDAATGSHSVTVTLHTEAAPAQKDPTEPRRKALAKTGDTIFSPRTITDRAGSLFIPLSQLTELRRNALAELERSIVTTHPFRYRRSENPDASWPESTTLTYHQNVANHLAEQFYRSHGATAIEPALEVSQKPSGPRVVMTTRHCIRRENGRCLLTPQGRLWPEKLFLVSGPNRYALSFDCSACQMKLLI